MAAVNSTNNKDSTTATTAAAKASYEDLEKVVKSLQAKLQIAETANTEIQNVNDSLAKRVEAIELQTKTEKVASIVSGAYDEDVEEKTAAFVKSGLSIDEISKIVAPLKASKTKVMKQASVGGGDYASQVAIRNDEQPATKKELPSWASNYLDLLNGGNS